MTFIKTSGTYTPVQDNLWAGTQVQPVVADAIELAASQGELKVGTVLGKVTATGLYKVTNKASEDGSEEVACVLAVDVDTGTDGEVVATAYFTGEFNINALTFGGESAAADHADDPRVGVSIFLKQNAK